MKMRKMKHLLQASRPYKFKAQQRQALLRWRQQRLAYGTKGHEMQRALQPELELVPSKRHNDLLLRFAGPERLSEASPEASERASTATTASCVQEELKALRAENEKLRSRPQRGFEGRLGFKEPSKRHRRA